MNNKNLTGNWVIKESVTLWGVFMAKDMIQGQIVTVVKQDETFVTVECGPAAMFEVDIEHFLERCERID